MHKKVPLEIISATNPFSKEQQTIDKVKVLLSIQEDRDDVIYFKTHFPNTKTFGNLSQNHGDRPLTEAYTRISNDSNVLLKVACPHIFFRKFLATDDMKYELFANGCRVWFLEEPVSPGDLKAAELFAEKKEDGTWIVEARWVGKLVIRHLDYVFYLTTK